MIRVIYLLLALCFIPAASAQEGQPATPGVKIVGPTAWVPIDASGAGLALTVNYAMRYSLGNITTITYNITYPTTVNGSAAILGGLPVAILTGSANNQSCLLLAAIGTTTQLTLGGAGATTAIPSTSVGATTTNAVLSGITLQGSCTYLTN